MGLMGRKILKLVSQRMSATLFSQSDDQQLNQYTISNIRPTKLHYANSMSPHTMTLSLPDAVLMISQPSLLKHTHTDIGKGT